MEMENKAFIVRNKKDYSSIMFIVIWLLICIYNAGYIFKNSKTDIFDYLFFIVSIYFFFQLIEMFFGKTEFLINNGKLIVKQRILFFPKSTSYNVDEIHNINIEHDAKSNDYWGFQGLRFYKTYDVLTFNYQNRKVVLGIGLEDFDKEKLKKAI